MPIDSVKDKLAAARRVLVLTGAGVSAESGVPTFRGKRGLTAWRGIPFEQLSSAEMVRSNLPLVWEWFDYRLGLVGNCAPNPAHVALAKAQSDKRFEQFTVVTQNIDGLHQLAGADDVICLHGNIRIARCVRCSHRKELREIQSGTRPPICEKCSGMMRPDVVLFGEMLPEGAFELAVERAENCDICLVVGTSMLVSPASYLPEIAEAAGAYLVEINPEETAFTSRCDASLRGAAGQIIPELFSIRGS